MEALRGLPTILREIAERTQNPSIAWRLLEGFGGLKLYVPYVIRNDDHELIQVLGKEDAALLVSEFGGLLEDIPTAAALKSKKIAILQMNESTRETAKKLKCTERWVRMVRNPDVDENQISLFDKE